MLKLTEKQKKAIAERILQGLESRKFFAWYNNGLFDNYICKTDEAATKENVLSDITSLLLD